MNKEWKDKWIKALRSDEYRRCLGVLCDLAAKENVMTKDYYGFLHDRTRNSYGIPDSAKKIFEIKTEEEGQLITMNDKLDKSFNDIANWIEENL